MTNIEKILDGANLKTLFAIRESVENVIRSKFERDVALLHTDIVGSTTIFRTKGDLVGKALQERHFDALEAAVAAGDGTIFSRAGDGAFVYFASAAAAVQSAISLQRAIFIDNGALSGGEPLKIRSGVHFGPTLIDGMEVAGDSVNLCARVTDLAGAAQLILTREAYAGLRGEVRASCSSFEAQQVKGIDEAISYTFLRWNDDRDVPTRILLEEKGELFELPNQAVVSIGRQRPKENKDGCDFVVRLETSEETAKVSRFHVELRRTLDSMSVRSLSRQGTTVDGALLEEGQEAAVSIGSTIKLSTAASIQLLGDEQGDHSFARFGDDGTIAVPSADLR